MAKNVKSDPGESLETGTADPKPVRAARKLLDPDTKEDIGEYDEMGIEHDMVTLPCGKVVPIWHYLGSEWDKRIVRITLNSDFGTY
jgi:hypothetical protein